MGLEDEAGTIEVGKRADLIILDRDPLADISNIRSVTITPRKDSTLLTAGLSRTTGAS